MTELRNNRVFLERVAEAMHEMEIYKKLLTQQLESIDQGILLCRGLQAAASASKYAAG